MFRRNGVVIAVLAILAVTVRIFSLYPLAVERYYSNGIYPLISAFQRILFGWLPFSVGDLAYGAAGMWLLVRLVKMIKALRRHEAGRAYWRKAAIRFIRISLAVYVSFNLLWGLNYNRPGVDKQLRLDAYNYTDPDLLELAGKLASKLNELQPQSDAARRKLARKRTLFNGVIESYRRLEATTPMLAYRFPSVKPSIYSYLGNYLGFTGYYNPFSGEAQVNTTVPLFIQPFTSCHEIGHQLGYARESEANFAGFLSARVSPDPSFRYSVYFDLYAYTARYLYMADSNALKKISGQLSPGVKKDFAELRRFYQKYDTPVEKAIDRLYGEFLRANQQPSGKMSYNEVVGLVIAYYRRYGNI